MLSLGHLEHLALDEWVKKFFKNKIRKKVERKTEGVVDCSGVPGLWTLDFNGWAMHFELGGW